MMPTNSSGDDVRQWIVNDLTYRAKLQKQSRNNFLAIAFLLKSNKGRYGGLCASLQNQFSRGTNQDPSDLTDDYNKSTSTKKAVPRKDPKK